MPLNEVVAHIDSFWPKSRKECFCWELGPIREVLPEFSVCRVEPPSPDRVWIYVSVGASDVKMEGGYRLEFMLEAPDDNIRHIETLAMVAYYHATSETIDLGHIMNAGRPWLNGSKCDHFLVSLPYLDGPSFEWCRIDEGDDIRFLWLLPITHGEADYAKKFGVEALEELFDERGIQPVDPFRKSVVCACDEEKG